MKKVLSLAIVAMVFGTTAKAQIGESKSKKNETTYTTRTVVVDANQNYNRIYFGYAPTKFSMSGDSETMHGIDFGWTGGYNVTKGKCLPLYVEAGLAMNTDFGECISTSDKLLNFEIPFSATYRYNFKNTKIYAAPYFGFHFKVNALWNDDEGDSYFDYVDANRFQFGMQLGVNFDINHFYVGFGWDKDFMPIADLHVANLNTSGARINIGYTF